MLDDDCAPAADDEARQAVPAVLRGSQEELLKDRPGKPVRIM